MQSYYDVVVITHDRVSEEINGKGLGQHSHPIFQPPFAVAEIFSSVAILTAKIRATHAPGGAVVVRRVIKTDLKASGRCHCDLFP